MIDVHAVGIDAERSEGVALRGEVLIVGGHPRVADLQSGHRQSVPDNPPSPVRITEPPLRHSSTCRFSWHAVGLRECRWGFLLRDAHNGASVRVTLFG